MDLTKISKLFNLVLSALTLFGVFKKKDKTDASQGRQL